MRKAFILIILFISVYSFAGGQADSDSEKISFESLKAIINSPDSEYILIDVRTAGEYAGGYIPTAVNIPYDVIAENLPTEDKNMNIILYCRSGHRAGIAKDTLESLGYTNVLNFGGVSNWDDELLTE